MKKYTITLIKGDGIGPEIIDEAVKVLDAVASVESFDFVYKEALMGGCAYDITGDPLPQETIDLALTLDAAGVVGSANASAMRMLPSGRASTASSASSSTRGPPTR